MLARKYSKSINVIKVLILSREPESLGGVVDYVDMLKTNFRDNITVTDFVIGGRKYHKIYFQKILQPFIDGFRLLINVTSHGYDVIHLNPSLNKQSVLRDGFFLIILKLLGKKNIVVLFHGWEVEYLKKIEKHKAYAKLFCNIFSCGKILVLASEYKKQLIDLGFAIDQVDVVTTMFNGELFSGVSQPKSSKNFYILFLSRLIVEKGLYELLDAFEELVESYIHVRLIIAGDGPEFDKLKSVVETRGLRENVQFTGFIRNQKKVEIMAKANVFVLPTYHGEGCPVSLLEAMAAGLPVISSRVGAIPEIVENYRNGILLETVSKAQILKSLRFCLNNSSFLSKAGENNYKKAWGNYEASVVTGRMENVYAQIANNSG